MPFVECCILSYFIHREPCFLPPYPVVCVDTRRLQRNQTITSPRYADDFRIVIHLLYHAAVPGMSPNVQNMQTGVMLQPIMNPMVSSPLFMVPGQMSQQPMQQQPIMATAVAEPLESAPSAPPMMTSKNNIAPPEGIINTSQGMVPASHSNDARTQWFNSSNDGCITTRSVCPSTSTVYRSGTTPDDSTSHIGTRK